MPLKIIENKIGKEELVEMAKSYFGNFVKAVVDVSREIMAVGGELHADGEAVLLEQGSRQEDLWGINIYPEKSAEEWIEFDSMINVRPNQGNLTRGVENPEIREKIKEIVKKLVV